MANNIKNMIKNLRLAKNMKVEELAQLVPVSKDAVYKWESGTNVPDIDTIEKLASIFEVSLDILVHGNEYESKNDVEEEAETTLSKLYEFSTNGKDTKGVFEKYSNSELSKIISEYYDRNNTVPNLIDKYGIDISPSVFIKRFPLIKSEMLCPYCNERMLVHLPSKTEIDNSEPNLIEAAVQTGNKYCPKCGHEMRKNRRGLTEVCKCSNCVSITKKKQEEEKSKRMLYLDQRKAKIKEVYGVPHEKVEFSQLPIMDKLMVVYLQRFFQSGGKYCFNYDDLYDVRDIFTVELLREYLNKSYITISPESDVEAFDHDNFPWRYSLYYVQFDLNVIFAKEEKRQIENNMYFSDCLYYEDVEAIIFDLLYQNSIRYLKFQLANREIELTIAEKTNKEFKKMIWELSYSEIMSICFNSSKDLSDKVVRGEQTKNYAKSAGMKYAVNRYNYFKEKGYDIKPYDFSKEHLTDWSVFVIEDCLNKSIESLFQTRITLDNFIQCESVNKDSRFDDFDHLYYHSKKDTHDQQIL